MPSPQLASPQVERALAEFHRTRDEHLQDLCTLVRIPSVSFAGFPEEEVRRSAHATAELLRARGFDKVRLLELPGVHPYVYGEHCHAPGKPTLLLYAHHDVQPAGDEDAWRTPVWELTEGDDGRWYGRGAADCKGNVVMHLTALRALQAVDGGFPCGIKLIVEGSEEQGTGGLEAFVPPNADLLRADTICVVDAGNAALGIPTLTTTLRGMTSVDITLEALGSAMHSGMFGGPAPDPVAGLVRVLASLHDADGNTTVDGLDNTGPEPMPTTWKHSGIQAHSEAPVLLGPEPLIPAQSIRLWLSDQPQFSLTLATDGVRPFSVRVVDTGP